MDLLGINYRQYIASAKDKRLSARQWNTLPDGVFLPVHVLVHSYHGHCGPQWTCCILATRCRIRTKGRTNKGCLGTVASSEARARTRACRGCRGLATWPRAATVPCRPCRRTACTPSSRPTVPTSSPARPAGSKVTSASMCVHGMYANVVTWMSHALFTVYTVTPIINNKRFFGQC